MQMGNSFSIVCLMVLCCQSGIEAHGRRRRAAANPPNIVFVLADDIGYPDIGYNGGSGHGIKTPCLDHLAERGIKLDNYYVQPICTPTRGTLLSGQ